jgi:hypothetical protein
MKRSAEAEVKNLIRKYRLVCERVHDCPIKPARQPGQLDCVSCIFRDIDVLTGKSEKTDYGTTITKLEAIENETVLRILIRQMGRQFNGQGQPPIKN